MAPTLYSPSQAYPDQRPTSLSVDVPPSSSPFPSPSSSFLPPPTPHAHEFAMKPPPIGRASRKSSVVPDRDDNAVSSDATSRKSASPHNSVTNGTSRVNGNSTPPPFPAAPPPSDCRRPSSPLNDTYALPSSPSHTATPMANTITLPDSEVTGRPTIQSLTSFSSSQTLTSSVLPNSVPIPHTPTTPSSPISYFSLSTSNGTSNPLDTPSSTRPAPASPVISRRVSQAPSTSSARSRSSRSSLPSSAPVSRANSTRKHHPSTSNPNADSVAPNFSRLSSQLQNITNLTMSNIVPETPPVSSPTSFAFVAPTAAQGAGAIVSSAAKQLATYVKIRDFAFAAEDERHFGLGADVPRANKAAQLNRALGPGRGWESMSDDGDMGDEDDDVGESWGAFGGGMAMGGFQFGVGRLSFHAGLSGLGGGMNGFPSKTDLDRNFLDDETMEDDEVEEDMFFDFEPGEVDGDEDGESGEEQLYPGLYRALYAFEPEGTAEMALEEDQIVRVVGRGGGVGWAVVVDDRERGSGGEVDAKAKLALVPESYLEAVRLDGVDE